MFGIKLWIAISGLIGCIAGIFICIAINKYSLLFIDSSIGIEINPIELISLIVNSILAFYIAKYLAKQNDSEKAVKELIISYLKEFQTEYKLKKELIIESDSWDSNKTKLYFKTLRQKLTSTLKLTEEIKIISNNDSISSNLKDKITEIWELFTDTPRKVESNTDQSLKEGIENLRLDKLSKIESCSIELDKLIFELSIKINQK